MVTADSTMTTSTITGSLFGIYQDAYLAIRRRYDHPDEPVLYRGQRYLETVPPQSWSKDTYTAYFGEVMRLSGWYEAAWRYAARRRKTEADRAEYLRACDHFAVAGHDLRFEGEPQQGGLW